MRLGTLIRLRDHQTGRKGNDTARETGTVKSLPDLEHLWELLDKNINLDVWKKGV